MRNCIYKYFALTILLSSFNSVYSQVDTLEMSNKEANIKSYFSNSESVISAEFIYGVPPVMEQNGSLSNYSINARFGLDLLTMPFTLEGNYNSFDTYSGINSYFRLSLDVSEMKKRKALLKDGILDSLNSKRSSIENSIQNLQGKLLYAVKMIDKLEGDFFKFDRASLLDLEFK